MILFVNTFITNENPNFKLSYQRGNLNTDDKLDIFKYSLASLAVAYNWNKVILKISLDDIYKHRQQELEEFFNKEDEPICSMCPSKVIFIKTENPIKSFQSKIKSN